MGINQILTKLFGNKAQRDMKEVSPVVDKIKAVYPEIQALSHDGLRARSQALRDELNNAVKEDKDKIAQIKLEIEETEIDKRERLYAEIDKLEENITATIDKKLDEQLPIAFSIMKDTARRFSENSEIEVTATDFDRNLAANPSHDFLEINGDKATYFNEWESGGNVNKWNMIHYDVQLIGGSILHSGKIAEMATGEGKTLVATLPVFLNALTGLGVHVVTVNDYLSKRDAEWMGPLYQFHGLSVDCVDKYRPNSDERRQAYNCDITFGTNNEFGFDYLRDNMASHPEDLVQRKHNYAIVDEVDSVLIDDARTPLIISGPVPKGEDQLFEEYQPRVENLVKQQHQMATAYLTEARQKMDSEDKKIANEGNIALFRSFKALPKNKALIKFLSEPGRKQKLLKTEEYFMQDNNREMPVAVDPLFFSIDEKQNAIDLTDKGIDLLTGTTDDPEFFVLPDVGSDIAMLDNERMDPDEKQAKKDEILQNYSVKAERVHTVNQLLKAYTLFEKDGEYVVMENKVMIVDEQTGRIMDGRRYSDGLHQAIEAKEHVKVEAATQTFATITLQNYFRMYHKLSGMTGTAETEAGELWDIYKLDVVVIPTNRPITRHDLEDRVYKTKREKFTAVIDEIQALVEQGRPVLVGTTAVDISELLSRMLNLRKIPHNVLNAKLHQREADIVAEAGNPGVVTIATNMAGRGTDIKLSDEVKAAGGLAIIGTERHESRRVDRQLRGRAGRQGDPGSSVFYVSLEDKLMRLFGSERISNVMDRLGFDEGERIEHSMISRSIERAQKKVEENNFGIRKRLLEYDDVMNQQRTVIYDKRRHALMGERIGVDIANTIYDTAEGIVNKNYENLDFEGLEFDLMTTLGMEAPFTGDEFRSTKLPVLVEQVAEQAHIAFNRKMEKLQEVANPVIQKVYENQGSQYKNILIPITDGKRMYNVPVNLESAAKSDSKEVITAFEKAIALHILDDSWKENLRELDDLRQSVQNASYEQKDPLLIYKLESFNIFKGMVENMNRRISSILVRAQIPVQEADEVQEAQEHRRQSNNRLRASKEDITQNNSATRQQDTRKKQVTQPIHADKKIGRNDPCPCGSGKKYKQCHGKNA